LQGLGCIGISLGKFTEAFARNDSHLRFWPVASA
jgi:hypothetical protein